jgi:hypothetical protein
VLLGVGEASDGAGDSAGLVTDERHSGDYIALGVEVHVAAGGGGGLLAVVEEVGFAVLVADEHEASATDVSGCRVDDRESKAYGYGGVDCVAALLQDRHAGVRGVVVNADDHGVGSVGGFEIRLLGEKWGGE